MSKNSKLRATWVKIRDKAYTCETVADYGRDPTIGYWRKLVLVDGARVEVRCMRKRGTFERYLPTQEGP